MTDSDGVPLDGNISNCVPTDTVCECNPKAIKDGAATTCYVGNEFGTCPGTRYCDLDGLTECVSDEPASEEVCDGEDNDCDGVVDENESVDAGVFYADTDGDGLVDKNDKCPKEFGTKENEGCPDEGVSNEKVIEEKDKLEPEDNVKNEEYSKSEIEKKINSSIYFELDQYSINPAEKNKLNNIKNLLDSNSNLNINIVGHASSDGPSDYNMSLSERRANNVKMTLINLGIDSNRLNVSFSGEDKPASSNSSKEGKSKNRRVEISVQ